ncbi:hypothetical protein PtA15_5A892 [Puccinia triticina]|uniref:Uncharacterized protein n=1 Tax=Puccinia triticina TaxID=208348 RepID=A0ABY7CRG3_9BASI|nr:uncharacterized protein PtA15_5A892 [Puccinia triticina]WAQ85317.1 hypothetical protein PtA15_5A892 [Puccinia triticina]
MSFDGTTATPSSRRRAGSADEDEEPRRPAQRQRHNGSPAPPQAAFNSFLHLNPTDRKGHHKAPDGLPDDPVALSPTQQLYANFGAASRIEDWNNVWTLLVVQKDHLLFGMSPLLADLDRDNCTRPTNDEVNIQVGLMA